MTQSAHQLWKEFRDDEHIHQLRFRIYEEFLSLVIIPDKNRHKNIQKGTVARADDPHRAKKEIAALKERLQAAECNLSKKISELEATQQTVAKLQKEQTATVEELRQCKSRLETSSKDTAALKGQLNTAEQDILKKTQELKKASQNAQRLSDKVTGNVQRKEELQLTVKRLEHEARAADTDLKKAAAEIQSRNARIEAMEKSYQNINDTLAIAEATITSQREQLAMNEEELLQKNSCIIEREAELTSMEGKLDEERVLHQNKADEHQREIAKLKQHCTDKHHWDLEDDTQNSCPQTSSILAPLHEDEHNRSPALTKEALHLHEAGITHVTNDPVHTDDLLTSKEEDAKEEERQRLESVAKVHMFYEANESQPAATDGRQEEEEEGDSEEGLADKEKPPESNDTQLPPSKAAAWTYDNNSYESEEDEDAPVQKMMTASEYEANQLRLQRRAFIAKTVAQSFLDRS